MTSRIHRGFHRIGVVVAVPLLLTSAALAGYEVWLQWKNQYFWAADPIVGHDAPTFLKRFGTSAYHANFVFPLILIVLAISLYIASRAVGWIFDGFLSPGPRP